MHKATVCPAGFRVNFATLLVLNYWWRKFPLAVLVVRLQQWAPYHGSSTQERFSQEIESNTESFIRCCKCESSFVVILCRAMTFMVIFVFVRNLFMYGIYRLFKLGNLVVC